MLEPLAGFTYRYVPPAEPGPNPTTLLLLHGTGGDESDLLPLGRALMPEAGLLSPRGQVLESGMPRFFRRLSAGVFDLEDLATRTDALLQFITSAASVHGIDLDGVVAVGFSNGANIAGSLLLRHPGALRRAVLSSAMVPFRPDALPDLAGTAVFVGAGRRDPVAPPEETERLAAILREAGADVTLHWSDGGHELTARIVSAARDWLLQDATSAV